MYEHPHKNVLVRVLISRHLPRTLILGYLFSLEIRIGNYMYALLYALLRKFPFSFSFILGTDVLVRLGRGRAALLRFSAVDAIQFWLIALSALE